MLILTRKIGQSVVMADDIVVTVLGIEGDRIKLGLTAPPTVRILRQELLDAIRDANLTAARSPDGHSLAALLHLIQRGGDAAPGGRPAPG